MAIGGFSPETLSRLSISFFALFGALLSAAAIGDGRPDSASVLLTFLGAGFLDWRPASRGSRALMSGPQKPLSIARN